MNSRCDDLPFYAPFLVSIRVSSYRTVSFAEHKIWLFSYINSCFSFPIVFFRLFVLHIVLKLLLCCLADITTVALLLWREKWSWLSWLGNHCCVHMHGFMWSRDWLQGGICMGSTIHTLRQYLICLMQQLIARKNSIVSGKYSLAIL